MAKHKTHYEECDILVVGGGMAGTGAAFEARYWGKNKKIVIKGCSDLVFVDSIYAEIMKKNIAFC